MKKIQVVDLVRSVAILVVLAGHLQALFVNHGSKYYALEYLWYKFWLNHGYGVSIFFVVSGFLITRLIALDKPGLFNPDLRSFYFRRIGRLLPLLIWTCIAGVVFSLIANPNTPQFKYCFGNPKVTISFPLLIILSTFSMNWYKVFHANHHLSLGSHWDLLWSLSIEEQFYLFYPLILKRLGNERNLVLLLVFLVILGPISILIGWRFCPHNNIMIYNSFAAFNLIAMGCLLYLVSERYKNSLLTRPKNSLLFCLSGLFVFLILYLHVYVRGDDDWSLWGNTFIGVGAFFFLLGGLHLSFFEKRFWSFLVVPGKLSYGMYLLHSTVLYFLWPYLLGKNEWVAFLLLAGITIGMAWLSYHYFEIPSNSWIRKKWGGRYQAK